VLEPEPGFAITGRANAAHATNNARRVIKRKNMLFPQIEVIFSIIIV
jgi:hypothetical protein